MDILQALKVNLGITKSEYDERLTAIIEAAKDYIETEGVQLTDTAGDTQLVVMYADWLWRKRDTDGSMPRMLRWNLNNRVMKETIANG